jgi:hypothetical protein
VQDVERYVDAEQLLGRVLDSAVIVPRLQSLYEWSAQDLDQPRLLELVRDGKPIYAWPVEQQQVWRVPNPAILGPPDRTHHMRSLTSRAADRPHRPRWAARRPDAGHAASPGGPTPPQR